jgi:hypothetical protein
MTILHRIDTPMTHPDPSVSRPRPQARVRLLALAAVIGCGHSAPFETPPSDRDQPFDPTPPVRLTLNHGPDRRAAWLADGSGILYSTQHFDSREHDVCLAQLPATGGSQRRLTCELEPNSINLTDALESAAPDSDGRLALVTAISNIGAAGSDAQSIALATVDDPATRRSLHAVPYPLPTGRVHQGVSQIHWLGPNRLVLLGEAVTVLRPCQLCPLDTLRSGLDGVWLDVTEPSPVTMHPIPGTDLASGVSAGVSQDEVYFTLNGDSRVYRTQISSGEVSVAHDFGAAGFARDVDVVGNRLAVVVGGRVAFAIDPSLGPTQWDSGGTIHVVNLQDGTEVIVEAPGPGLVRRPRLSPTASAVVAEVYPLIITDNVPPDTLVSTVADLFTFGLP